MFNMRSASDAAHINSVCALACPLPIWPELVVACRISLSSVSSGCAKLLLVESGFPELFFVAISLRLARFFMNTLNVFDDVFGHPDPFLLHKQPSSLNFLPCPNLHCCWRLFSEHTHKCMLDHSLVRL